MNPSSKVERGSKRRPRKEYPYFKVQVLLKHVGAWSDLVRAHQEIEGARSVAIEESFKQDARIMEVLGDRDRRPGEHYREGKAISV